MMSFIRIIALLLLVAGAPSLHAQVVHYVHTDALGSVVALTDQSGAVVERREYEPYGVQLTPSLQDGPGYTGHVQDAATSLVYMQQRYYDPESGLFLSVDPVTAYSNPVGQFNRYRYANGNPYRFYDPDGRCTGSRITNSDGTCKSTGGFTTQSFGASSPSNSRSERPNNASTASIGQAASSEANSALARAGVAGKEYGSRGAAAKAWSKVVQGISDKHNTEIASRLFYSGAGRIVVGSATSDGLINSVNPSFSEGPSPFSITAGFVHTHPDNSLFSGNDLNYAITMYRAVNGWSRSRSGVIEQTAFVSRPDGKVFGWDASSYIETNGSSYMNKDYYVEY